MALTAKQERFVQEYLVDRNATQAAIRAGYSDKTAEVIGYENLRKPQIAEEVSKRERKLAEKAGITQERVIEALASIGLKDIDLENLRPADKIKALELLGKHLGMFSDKPPAEKQPEHNDNLYEAIAKAVEQ